MRLGFNQWTTAKALELAPRLDAGEKYREVLRSVVVPRYLATQRGHGVVLSAVETKLLRLRPQANATFIGEAFANMIRDRMNAHSFTRMVLTPFFENTVFIVHGNYVDARVDATGFSRYDVEMEHMRLRRQGVHEIEVINYPKT